MCEDAAFLFDRFQEFASMTGLNCVLVSVRPDPTRDSALICTVLNNGAYPPTFDQEIDKLKTCLQGNIADISWGESVDYTEFSWKPLQ